MRDLAPELQLQTLRLCSSHDLACLSRTHTSLRDIAEHILYSDIQYTIYPVYCPGFDPTQKMSLLSTLSTNVQKASLVKKLHIRLNMVPYPAVAASELVLHKLTEGLKNMPNLVDLRILDIYGSEITQVIKNCHFRLHTLFWHAYGDLEGIIDNQHELRLLGLYHDQMDVIPMAEIKKVYDNMASRHHSGAAMPIVFSVGCPSWASSGSIKTLGIFPALHQSGQISKMCGEIMSSLTNKGSCHYDHLSLNLLGICEENMGLLCEAMEVMAALPNSCLKFSIEVCHTSMQKPWEFPEFVQRFALFQNIKSLIFCFNYMINEQYWALCSNLQSCLVQELGQVWPKLKCAYLLRQGEGIALPRSNGWEISRIIDHRDY